MFWAEDAIPDGFHGAEWLYREKAQPGRDFQAKIQSRVLVACWILIIAQTLSCDTAPRTREMFD